jgi:hypothetical protein
MAEWSEDHVAAIGSLNSNFGLVDRTWLNWRPGGALRWKVETAGWDGRGV